MMLNIALFLFIAILGLRFLHRIWSAERGQRLRTIRRELIVYLIPLVVVYIAFIGVLVYFEKKLIFENLPAAQG